MTPALEFLSLNKSFGNRKALDAVTLSIKPGEMVALLGASGSGKSTLLRHVTGFIRAESGCVKVNGQTVQTDGVIDPRIRSLRTDIGVVFQQFNLVERLSVMTNVMAGTLGRSNWLSSIFMRFSMEQRQRAMEALLKVGIEHTAWQRASTLSGGQQQRAAIARCIVQGARLILADEPIASLDPESARRVMELLCQLNREEGCTIVVSLHQLEFAVRYCPRLVALRGGRVVYDGPSSALTREVLADLYGAQTGDLIGASGVPLQSGLSIADLPITPIVQSRISHHTQSSNPIINA